MKIGIVILILAIVFFGGYFIKDITTPKKTPEITPSVTIQISPTDSLPSTNTPIPIPTKTSAPKPQQPTDRALRVAGYVYVEYKDEEGRNKIRELAGITKTDENTEIIQLALWLDKNQGILAKWEAVSNTKSKPQLNCSSYTVGDQIYTNCN